MENLSTVMEATLKDGNLQNVSMELAEVLIDNSIKDGALQDIPILSTIIGVTKTVGSVKDYLFTKKLLAFLTQTKQIPKEKRKEIIDKIDQSKKYRTKVGEKILFLVDKCDDTHKAEFIGILFNALLNEHLDYNGFQKAAFCVERTHLPTLVDFIQSSWTELDIDDGGAELISTGLMEMEQISPHLKVTEKTRFGNPDDFEYYISNAKLKCTITQEGNNIRKHLHP